TDADVAACIRWTHDQGAKVISMSLGGPTASRTIAAATRYAWENGGRGGSVLVAAAGNDGTNAIEYPAGRPEVVPVGAVVDLGAPGRDPQFGFGRVDLTPAVE